MQPFSEQVSKPFPKIVCVGKNYLKHAKEMGDTQVPKEPVIFTKPWGSLSYAPKQLDLSSTGRKNEIHHEIELGVLIGKRGYRIQRENAMEYVNGYVLALDLTDRDLQAVAKKAGLPWDLSKGQDNFCPVSEFVDSGLIINPYDLDLELSINGQIKQRSRTGEMHFKIEDIIAYTSQFMTLNPGDLILTGTPEGVGPISPEDKV